MNKKEQVGGRHKWNIYDKCEKCGLERKRTRLSPDGMVFGRLSHSFYVNGEWVAKKVACNNSI